ncbi:PIN domain-containing protein [Parvularcula dongshanensis]|uniref:PIN domain nuclease of toxin-antitoxin system n=1 Tax=Parvularcula dongshanensis TaxID=1173995 RepID=A0A840I7Z1_9PROT|nr:PIN domain nuclease of toxin-antitoxin system [Parvularcula dongshanensis]
MTTLVIDTNALIFAATNSPKLTARARATMEEGGNLLLASTASVYEVGNKHCLGKMPFSATAFHGSCLDLGVLFRAPSVAVMQLAAELEWEERDPWDRIIAATAIDLAGGQVVTRDEAFDHLAGIERVW